jgi:hypothetical protein
VAERLRRAGSLGRVELQERADEGDEELVVGVQPVAKRGDLGRAKEWGFAVGLCASFVGEATANFEEEGVGGVFGLCADSVKRGDLIPGV